MTPPYQKKWREANPDKFKATQRRYNYKRKYGISQEAVNQMLNDQAGACAVCWKRFDTMPSVDHDHVTGKVRGLLCRRCNAGIGMFLEDPVLMERAATYINKGR